MWDTWIVGDSIAGQNVDTALTVAVIADDLPLLGVASKVATVNFHINADPA